MSKYMPRFLMLMLTVALVIPESEAKRVGSGRSSGRQAQIARQRATPPVQPPRPAPSTPPSSATANTPPVRPVPNDTTARGPAAPVSPQQSIPRQAASPWGGMLGGALLGLGLGSLMSGGSNNGNSQTADNNGTNGANSDLGSSGASGDYDNGPQSAAAPAEQTSGSFGPALMLGALALVVYLVARKIRRRGRLH